MWVNYLKITPCFQSLTNQLLPHRPIPSSFPCTCATAVPMQSVNKPIHLCFSLHRMCLSSCTTSRNSFSNMTISSDLIHPSPASYLKTLKLFLSRFSNCPRFTTYILYNAIRLTRQLKYFTFSSCFLMYDKL